MIKIEITSFFLSIFHIFALRGCGRMWKYLWHCLNERMRIFKFLSIFSFFYSFWHFSSYYWQFHFLYYYPKIIFKSLTTCCWCLKNCRCHEVLSAVELCLLSEKRKQLRRFLKLFDFVSYQIENHILITPTYQVSKRVKA